MKPELALTVPDILKDARQLYQTHRRMATKPNKVANLDRVWEVLNAIRDDGGRDYSLAEVGRRLAKAGGPKTQSMRNRQGAHYREIIAAYANAVSGATRYVAKTKSNVEQALSLISDQSVRATIRVALDEANRLKVVNDNLHAAFKTLQIGATISPQPPPKEQPPIRSDLRTTTLSPRFMNALRKGIDEARLAQQGMRVADNGSIENEHGDQLFPPAFVIAIQTILKS